MQHVVANARSVDEVLEEHTPCEGLVRVMFDEIMLLRDTGEAGRLDGVELKCALQEAESERGAYKNAVGGLRKENSELKAKLKAVEKQVAAAERRASQVDGIAKRTEDRLQEMFDEMRPEGSPRTLRGEVGPMVVLPDHSNCSISDIFTVVQSALTSIKHITHALETTPVNPRETDHLQKESVFAICLLSEITSLMTYAEDMCLGICDEPDTVSPNPPPSHGPVFHRLSSGIRAQSIATKTVIGKLRRKLIEANCTGPLSTRKPETCAKAIRSEQLEGALFDEEYMHISLDE